MKPLDVSLGDQFGPWVVTDGPHSTGHGYTWSCRCIACGGVEKIRATDLDERKCRCRYKNSYRNAIDQLDAADKDFDAGIDRPTEWR